MGIWPPARRQASSRHVAAGWCAQQGWQAGIRCRHLASCVPGTPALLVHMQRRQGPTCAAPPPHPAASGCGPTACESCWPQAASAAHGTAARRGVVEGGVRGCAGRARRLGGSAGLEHQPRLQVLAACGRALASAFIAISLSQPTGRTSARSRLILRGRGRLRSRPSASRCASPAGGCCVPWRWPAASAASASVAVAAAAKLLAKPPKPAA